MEKDHIESVERESDVGRESFATANRRLGIIGRYSDGVISAREAARELGRGTSEHDVFAALLDAGLALPMPSPEILRQEVAALRLLYGPHGPRATRGSVTS